MMDDFIEAIMLEGTYRHLAPKGMHRAMFWLVFAEQSDEWGQLVANSFARVCKRVRELT
jgi:hypothetical protein